PRPQVLLQHLLKLGEPDPPPSQRLAITIPGQVRMASKDMRALLDRLVKRQFLKGMKCIMMNKYGDRPLRGQQVRGVFDRLAQAMQVRAPISLVLRRTRCGGSERLHVRHRTSPRDPRTRPEEQHAPGEKRPSRTELSARHARNAGPQRRQRVTTGGQGE